MTLDSRKIYKTATKLLMEDAPALEHARSIILNSGDEGIERFERMGLLVEMRRNPDHDYEAMEEKF